jgi:hypothetical protein
LLKETDGNAGVLYKSIVFASLYSNTIELFFDDEGGGVIGVDLLHSDEALRRLNALNALNCLTWLTISFIK